MASSTGNQRGGQGADTSASAADRGRELPPPRPLESERQELQQRISAWLDLPLAILSLIWTALFLAELVLPLPPRLSESVVQADFVIWLIFSSVFALELALAPRKLEYLRTNLLTALSVVLPFVRVVRIARVARLLRSLSLVRMVLIANRATQAIADMLREHHFQYVLSLIAIATLLGAAGASFFERDTPGSRLGSFGEALWWAATMITTVNIGAEPVTTEGRIIGLLLRVAGLALFGYVTASIAAFLMQQRAPGRTQDSSEPEAVARLAEELARVRALLEQTRALPDAETERPASEGGARQ